MNDSWLLGGVRRKQSFHLVTEGLDQQTLTAAMDKLQAASSFELARARFGPALESKGATVQGPEGVRRFYCEDPGRAEDATLTLYFQALNKLLFHQGKDPVAKATVLKALSKWLFGQEDAL